MTETMGPTNQKHLHCSRASSSQSAMLSLLPYTVKLLVVSDSPSPLECKFYERRDLAAPVLMAAALESLGAFFTCILFK